MAKKTINLTGTAGRNYNMDQIEQDNRTNSEKPLVVQVWKWNPNLPDVNDPHRKPNPDNLQVGQIWLSKKVIDSGV